MYTKRTNVVLSQSLPYKKYIYLAPYVPFFLDYGK